MKKKYIVPYLCGLALTLKEGTIYVISATVITFILWDILVPLFIAGYPFSNTTPAIVFGIIAYWIIPTQNSNVDDSKAVDSNTKEENSNE